VPAVLPEPPLGEGALATSLLPGQINPKEYLQQQQAAADKLLEDIQKNNVPVPIISPVNDETGVATLNDFDMTTKFDLQTNPNIKGSFTPPNNLTHATILPAIPVLPNNMSQGLSAGNQPLSPLANNNATGINQLGGIGQNNSAINQVASTPNQLGTAVQNNTLTANNITGMNSSENVNIFNKINQIIENHNIHVEHHNIFNEVGKDKSFISLKETDSSKKWIQ
jgi:hypothetical protein